MVRGKSENGIEQSAPRGGVPTNPYPNAGVSGDRPGNQTTGILVVGHGSRREEANQDVRQAARLIGERGGFPLVLAAFLEIASPTIHEGFAALTRKARGMSSFILIFSHRADTRAAIFPSRCAPLPVAIGELPIR